MMATRTERPREPLRCDCHARAILAERDGARIIIRNKRGGELHTLIIDIVREYERLMESRETATRERPERQPESDKSAHTMTG